MTSNLINNYNEKNSNEKELNLLHIVLFILKNIKALLLNFIIISIVSAVIAFSLTKYYESTVRFIPQGPTGNNLLAMFGSSYSGDILGASKFSKRQYITLLQSRELREEIIKKFDLISVYKQKELPNALDRSLKILDKRMQILAEEEGGLGITDIVSIEIKVVDNCPQRAADIANYAYSLMEKKVLELHNGENQQMLNFLLSQNVLNDSLFDKWKNELKAFKIKYKLYDISSQITMTMQVIGSYQAELNMLNTQKAYLESNNYSNNIELKSINQKIAILKNKLIALEENKNVALIPGLKNSLDLSNQYYELMKKVETYSQINQLLIQQIEIIKIKVQKNYTELFLVDSARPPEWKIKPKRAFVMVGIVSAYMVFCLIFLFFRGSYKTFKEQYPEKYLLYKGQLQSALFKNKK
ncbi:MAG: hypothetical protein GX639_11680 [Fibrobacter sp.]|nr:hypothetical protein [Fibrobacter sp.]